MDGQISFCVTDTGQGIDDAYLGRIFERYFQVPGRLDKKGSGLVLRFVKSLLRLWAAKFG
jgi:signal transduction histidine kinase